MHPWYNRLDVATPRSWLAPGGIILAERTLGRRNFGVSLDSTIYCSQRSMTTSMACVIMGIHALQYTDSTSGITEHVVPHMPHWRYCKSCFARTIPVQLLNLLVLLPVTYDGNQRLLWDCSGITIRSACYEIKRAMLSITHGSRTESIVP